MLTRGRTLINGLLALAAILVLLVAVPVLLVHFAGSPIPDQMPNWSQTWTRWVAGPADGSNWIPVLQVVGWLAWAVSAVSIVLETVAQLRHVRPPRIPIAGHTVAAVLALATLTATSTAGAGRAVALQNTVTHDGVGTVATAPHTPTQGSSTTTTPKTHTLTRQVPLQVTVDKGDSLWKIAGEQLGDGAAYPQLYQANRGTTQPDGRHLSDPDHIQPGWHLSVPGKTTTITTTVPDPTPPSPTHADSALPAQATNPAQGTQTAPVTPSPVPAPGTASPGAPGGGGAPASSATPTGTPTTAPTTTSPPSQASSPATEAAPAATDDAIDSHAPIPVRTIPGLGALAAAGALVLLGRRRAQQTRRRRPGQRIPLPTADAAIAEAQLRAAADPLTATHLDLALRTIAHHAKNQGQSLPPLRAARITTDTIELYLADDDATLPAPFNPDPDDTGTWTLPRTNLNDLLDPHTAAAVHAPYPTLVTLGHDEHDAHLLIHLEEITALAIHGNPETTHAVLTALALELIGSEWADDVRVTLAGVLPDLADALGSDRVNYVDELDEILTALEYSADVHAAAMTRVGAENPVQARGTDLSPEAWTPHLILTTRSLGAAEAGRVDRLLHRVPRLAIAAITAGGTDLGEWTLQVTGDPTNTRAVLLPAGLEITPQRLAGAAYDALIAAFRTTDEDPVDGPAWGESLTGEPVIEELPPAADDARQQSLDDIQVPDTIAAILDSSRGGGNSPAGDRTAPVDDTDVDEDADELAPIRARVAPGTPMLRLLGDIEVLSPPGKRPNAPGTATKIITFLALHPGASTEQLDEAIWPGLRKRSETRATDITKARNWLGTAADGHPYLSYFEETGDYRCRSDMPCDWWILRDLIGAHIAKAPTTDLVAALHLVDGVPMTGPRFRTAVWVMPHQSEMTQTIGDLAHEVATRATEAGNPRQAAWAAGKGLTVDPTSEVLWRDALRAAHQCGTTGRVEETLERLNAALAPLGGDLDDATEDLINELLNRATANA